MNKIAFEIALAKRGIRTTTELSDAVGISRTTLTPIRTGKKEATVETAAHISKVLEFDETEFAAVFPFQYEVVKAAKKYLCNERRCLND